MSVSDGIIYAEVYDILKNMEKISVMKIPMKFLEYIKNNRDINYKSKVDKNDLFNPSNISKEAMALFAWLDLEYLSSEEDKIIKKKIYDNNEKKYQNELRKKYDPNKLFDNNSTNNNDNNLSLEVEDKKENGFKQILKRILNFFRIK